MGKDKYQDGIRISKDGKPLSFVIYNTNLKKNKRIHFPKYITILEQAQEYRKNELIKAGTSKARAQKRHEFLNKYFDQDTLFSAYSKERSRSAPRSYQMDISRLKNYVLPFFVGQKNCNHPSQWFSYWKEFQEHLKNDGIKVKKMAINSVNNVIKSANSYIAFVELEESGEPIKRIPELKYDEKGARGKEAVYSDEECEKLEEAFGEYNLGLLIKLLRYTGMRIGEALSLRKTDVIIGSIPQGEKWIFRALQDSNVEFFGYILLKSQLEDLDNLKSKRVALKGRKSIKPENNRVIPLINKELSEALLKLSMNNEELLFNVEYRIVYTALLEARKKLNWNQTKDLHSLRHTFTTRFVRMCGGDPRIVEKVLGHSKPKITQNYNHLADELEASNVNVPSEVKPLKIV